MLGLFCFAVIWLSYCKSYRFLLYIHISVCLSVHKRDIPHFFHYMTITRVKPLVHPELIMALQQSPNITKGNWVAHKFQLQTAISRKRKKVPEIRWRQNSRLFEGVHPLFYESGLVSLFHPISASFSQKKNTFSRCSRGYSWALSGQNMPPERFSMEEKKINRPPIIWLAE